MEGRVPVGVRIVWDGAHSQQHTCDVHIRYEGRLVSFVGHVVRLQGGGVETVAGVMKHRLVVFTSQLKIKSNKKKKKKNSKRNKPKYISFIVL